MHSIQHFISGHAYKALKGAVNMSLRRNNQVMEMFDKMLDAFDQSLNRYVVLWRNNEGRPGGVSQSCYLNATY